jgi:hypothetical protein
MENLGSFDLLVKLASFGTAGVCILAIFIIGYSIFKLPNDVPNWKPELMKKFINASIIIAVITAISGGLNAYFNQQKIQEADTGTAVVATEYNKLKENYDQLYEKIESLSNLIAEMSASGSEQGATSAVVAEQTEAARAIIGDVRYYKAKSVEDLISKKRMDVIRDIPAEQIRRRQP